MIQFSHSKQRERDKKLNIRSLFRAVQFQRPILKSNNLNLLKQLYIFLPLCLGSLIFSDISKIVHYKRDLPTFP